MSFRGLGRAFLHILQSFLPLAVEGEVVFVAASVLLVWGSSIL
jgi:hypothetical protein